MESTAPRGPVFFGEYDLTIDEKHRFLVPSEVRKAFNPERDGQAFFVTIGVNDVIWLYPVNYYEELAHQAPADVTPGEDQLAYDQINFSLASRVEWDKQGRLLIPDKTLKRTHTETAVSLIGVRDHLELWNRANWEVHRESLSQRRADISRRARLARQDQ